MSSDLTMFNSRDIEKEIAGIIKDYPDVSNIFISANKAITIRLYGKLQDVGEPISGSDTNVFIASMLGTVGLENQARDLSFIWKGYRVSVLNVKNQKTAILHRLPSLVDISKLGQASVVYDMAKNRRGGILVITGGKSEGTTTTVLSLLKHMAETESYHILTLESAVEAEIPQGKSFISQRNKWKDFKSASASLSNATMQDVDIVYLDNVYCTEDIDASVRLAEQGMLIIISLKQLNAVSALGHCLDFSSNQQRFLTSLIGIVAQELCKVSNSITTIAEVLVPTEDVINEIRLGNLYTGVENIMERGDCGMQTFRQGIEKLSK